MSVITERYINEFIHSVTAAGALVDVSISNQFKRDALRLYNEYDDPNSIYTLYGANKNQLFMNKLNMLKQKYLMKIRELMRPKRDEVVVETGIVGYGRIADNDAAITELEKRLAECEKNKDKAEAECKKANADLKNQITILIEERKKLEKTITKYENTSTIKDLQTENTKLQGDVQEASNNLEKAKQEYEKLKQAKEEAEEKLKQAKEEAEAAAKAKEEAEAAKAKVAAEAAEEKLKQAEAAEEKLKQAKAAVEEKAQQAKAAEEKTKQAEEKLEECKKELEKCNEKLKQSETAAKAKVEQDKKDCDDKMDKLTSQIAELEQKIKINNDTLAKYKKTIDDNTVEYNNKLNELQQENVKLKQQLNEAKQATDKCQTEKAQQAEELQKYQTEKKQQANALQEANKKQQKYQDTLTKCEDDLAKCKEVVLEETTPKAIPPKISEEDIERKWRLMDKTNNKLKALIDAANNSADTDAAKNAENTLSAIDTSIKAGKNIYESVLEQFNTDSKASHSRKISKKLTNWITNYSGNHRPVIEANFYDEYTRPNKMEDLLAAALGSVSVFVKLKVAKDMPNDLIIIKDKQLTLTTSDTSIEHFNTDCFDNVYPIEYDNLTPLDKEASNSNSIIYKNMKETLDLSKKGYHVVLFGSGYSGSGKSYTLTDAGDSIIAQYFTELGSEYNVEMYAFEQYGRLDANESMNISLILDKNRGRFYEQLYIYYNKGELCSIINDVQNDIKIPIVNSNNNYILLNTSDNDASMNRKNYKIVMESIRKTRIIGDNNRIRATINNVESSRSHIYYVFKIRDTTNNVLGYLTIADFGGQEAPNEIIKDYMKSGFIGTMQTRFNNYFNYLFDINNNTKLPSQSRTINNYIKYITSFIYNIDKNHTLYLELNKIESVLQQWIYITFKYPLYAILAIYSQIQYIQVINQQIPSEKLKFMKGTIPIDTKYGVIPLKTENDVHIFYKLVFQVNSALSVYERSIDDAFKKRINIISNMLDLSNTFDGFIKKYNKQYADKMYQTTYTESAVKQLDYVSILNTFLEGFYINDTLVTKTRYLKGNQGFGITSGEGAYRPIYDPKYDPYSLKLETSKDMNAKTLKNVNNNQNIKTLGNNKTAEIFNMLDSLMKDMPSKYIELAAIRADAAPDESIKYKYAKATCTTLKSSALISSKQCDVQNKCAIKTGAADEIVQVSPYVVKRGGNDLSTAAFIMGGCCMMPFSIILLIICIIILIVAIGSSLYCITPLTIQENALHSSMSIAELEPAETVA